MAIERATGIKAVLVHSRDMGALEIMMNGVVIFSKKESGRFPDHAEIIEKVKTGGAILK